MKKVILCYLVSCSSIGYSQTPIIGSDSHWVEEWTDDFTQMNIVEDMPGFPNYGDGTHYLNVPSQGWKWKIVENFDHGGEPQVYKLENITMDTINGIVLLLEKATTPLTIYTAYDCTGSGCAYQYHEFSSGMIESAYNAGRNVRYGYLEAEIKMTDEYGMFPAFWLWSSNGSTEEEEIDIFEMIPGTEIGMEITPLTAFPISNPYVGAINDKYLMTSNIHKFNPLFDNDTIIEPNPNTLADPNRFDEITYTNLRNIGYTTDYTVFHKYAIEWSPNKIIYYIDGEIIKNVSNPFIENQDKTIIINLALANFTNWSGLVDSLQYYEEPPIAGQTYGKEDYEWTQYYYNQTNFSNAKLTIKNIAYYTLDMSECSTAVEIYSYVNDLNNYNSKVKKSITISNVALTNDSPKVLRASEHITLNAGFDSNGKELYLDVNNCY